MPNNKEFLGDFEIERHIKMMNDRDLLEFTARQVYDVCGIVNKHGLRLHSLEVRGNKITGIAGGIGTMIGAAVVAVINWFVDR